MSGNASPVDPETDKASSGSVPSAWGQRFPRSLRLAPDGLLVPAGTLRVLLKKSGRLEAVYAGFALAPWIRDGDRIVLDAGRTPRTGDLALCDVDGWGDLRRLLGRGSEGRWITALDPFPAGRETLAAGRVLAVVTGKCGAGGWVGGSIAAFFPLWSRLAALLHALRKALSAPDFGEEAAGSVRRKYASQVESYTRLVHLPPGEELRDLLRKTIRPGGSILVAGSGAGGEAIHLARAGYRVQGFDVLDEMQQAARRNAAGAGVDVDFFRCDMSELDLPGRTFDGIYVTPLVYSFIRTRSRRVLSLRRLGRHLAPGASVVYSAHLLKSFPQAVSALLAWARHAARRPRFEFGDWYTWFLLPDGTIDRSFTHLFTTSRILREARAAGFRQCRREGAYFIAGAFGAPAEGEGSSTAR